MDAALKGKHIGLSLRQAQACWPKATVASNGAMPSPGEYIIPHGYGWIHAGFSVGAPVVNGQIASSRTALAYGCGYTVSRTINSWEQWLTNISFTTGDQTVVCNSDSWSNWQTPACSGGGNCAAPSFGVIGQHTYQVNPWYNQTVYYIAVTDFFYCRHYLSADANASWSAYCN